MKISWVCLSLFLGLLKVYGQPVQVSANDLLVEAALIEAAKQHFLHNTDKAVAIYEKLLKDHPDNDLADYYLSMIYQDSARWEKAVFHGLSAVKKSPGNIWFQQKLASIYLQSDQFKSAIPVLQFCIEREPKNAETYQQLIHCFQKINDWNAALKVLDQLELVWGVLPKTVIQRYELYHKSGNIVKAKKELLNLITLFPSNPDHFYLAASYFVKNKDKEGAITILKQLLTIDPDAAQARFELDELENKTSTPSILSLTSFFSDNQIDTEKKKTRLLPEISQLLISRDPILKSQLLSLCKAMEVAHPSDALPLSIQADIFSVMGSVDTAILMYKKALEKEESLFFIWEKYLEFLWKNGKSVKLTKEALFAWDIFPNNPLVPFYVAYGFIFQGKISEALPLIEEALLQSTKNEELSLHLNALKALAISIQGDKENAKNLFLLLKANEKYPFLGALYVLSGINNGQSSSAFLLKGNEIETALYSHAKALLAAQSNQPELALKLFSEYEKWGTPLFFEHWGDTFLMVNKTSEAEKTYKKSAESGNTGQNLSVKLSKF
jgi:tetratricopeptide (TPR) repeat protein